MLGSERVPASLARGFETPSSGNVLELASVIPSESTDMPPVSLLYIYIYVHTYVNYGLDII